MKTIRLSACIFMASLTLPAVFPAHAGGGGHYGYYGGGHHWGHGHRHYRGCGHYHGRDYRWGYRHGYRHGRRHNHDAEYLLGGIIIGSLIGQAYHNSSQHTHRHYYHSDNYYRSDTRHYYYPSRTVRRVVYRHEEPVVYRESEALPVAEHVLLRDRDGRCFSVTETDDGTELRTEIDAEACKTP